jgi:glycosyltransferase involved in cell wall biosynthesis/peptidoglycan/xylan/chitin deacetylase (PgdA/CDA1 family)
MILSEVSPHSSPLTTYDMSLVMPLRIGIMMDHPSPHMVSLLGALAEREDCIAHVIYLGKSAPERKWGAPLGKLPSRFIPGFSFLGGGRRMNPSITHALGKQQADVWVVNTCYDSPSTVLAAWFLGKRKTPWVYMNEPPRPRNLLFNASKSFPFRFVVGRAWGLIGMGEKTAEIYSRGGNGSVPTTSVPYFIDLKPFYELPGAEDPEPGMPFQFLTCCQMIHRKGLDVLLQACSRLTDLNWQLTLIGSGPLRPKLEKKFHERFSAQQVIFGGEIPYEKRQEAFRQKHVFVFPSRWDGWGMVLPEALAAGLPVIATDQVISAHEFIRNGANGFIVPAENPQALTEKMEYFIHHREEIAKMGTAARRSVLDYLPEKGAERLVRFLKDLVNHSPKESSTFNRGLLGECPVTWESLTSSNSLSEKAWRKTRQAAKKAVIRLGNSLSMRAKANSHRILVYHLVLPRDRKSFEEHIRFLQDHYLLCSIPEVYEAACSPQTNGSYRAAITFDDGFRILMSDCLEVLQRHGVKATFLVPTGFVDLWDKSKLANDFSLRAHYYSQPMEPMQPRDLKALKDLGHSIGSHGISHVSLSSMPRERALKELKQSRQRIGAWTGAIPELFAYPYGHASHADGHPSAWVRETGYSFGLTLRRGPVNSTSDPMALPREHAEGNWSVQDLKYFLFS